MPRQESDKFSRDALIAAGLLTVAGVVAGCAPEGNSTPVAGSPTPDKPKPTAPVSEGTQVVSTRIPEVKIPPTAVKTQVVEGGVGGLRLLDPKNRFVPKENRSDNEEIARAIAFCDPYNTKVTFFDANGKEITEDVRVSGHCVDEQGNQVKFKPEDFTFRNANVAPGRVLAARLSTGEYWLWLPSVGLDPDKEEGKRLGIFQHYPSKYSAGDGQTGEARWSSERGTIVYVDPKSGKTLYEVNLQEDTFVPEKAPTATATSTRKPDSTVTATATGTATPAPTETRPPVVVTNTPVKATETPVRVETDWSKMTQAELKKVFDSSQRLYDSRGAVAGAEIAPWFRVYTGSDGGIRVEAQPIVLEKPIVRTVTIPGLAALDGEGSQYVIDVYVFQLLFQDSNGRMYVKEAILQKNFGVSYTEYGGHILSGSNPSFSNRLPTEVIPLVAPNSTSDRPAQHGVKFLVAGVNQSLIESLRTRPGNNIPLLKDRLALILEFGNDAQGFFEALKSGDQVRAEKYSAIGIIDELGNNLP